MRLEEYKQVYDKVTLSKEADERILQELQEKVSNSGMKQKRKGIRFAQVAAAVAVLVLAVGIMQFPAVASTAQDLVSSFTDYVVVSKSSQEDIEKMEKLLESGEGIEFGYPTSVYEYNDSGEYLEVNSDAPRKECKMDCMDAVSKALGIDLLQSGDAYEQENCILYTPYVSESGALNGVILQDTFYALGDIRDPKIEVFKDLEKDGRISYHDGEEYHSPIMMEAAIRTNAGEELDNEIPELDYSRQFVDLTGEDSGTAIVQEIHEIESLGVEATLSFDVPGSHTWNKLDGEEPPQCIDAVFTYQGVEYRYVGAVSIETMQEFLEGLEIP